MKNNHRHESSIKRLVCIGEKVEHERKEHELHKKVCFSRHSLKYLNCRKPIGMANHKLQRSIIVKVIVERKQGYGICTYDLY